jgi:Spy/CpxP family protein refolding chaperone
MQKLIATAAILLTVLFSFAQQTVSSDFYAMKNTQEAGIVLNIINSELNLSAEAQAKLKHLLEASAQSQSEQLAFSPASQERTNVMLMRQSNHIEANLKAMITPEQYNTYLRKKADMVVKLTAARQAASGK